MARFVPTGLGILNGVPLRRMREPLRSLFAEVRRKDREAIRAARVLAGKKRREIERLTREWRPGSLDRPTASGLVRQCRWCWREKPMEQFVWKGDGYRPTCKVCFYELRASAALRSPYRERERERRRTNALVRRGVLVKTPCEECGDPKTQRHHFLWDGSGRRIRWLCQGCHDEEHARVGKRSASRLDYR